VAEKRREVPKKKVPHTIRTLVAESAFTSLSLFGVIGGRKKNEKKGMRPTGESLLNNQAERERKAICRLYYPFWMRVRKERKEGGGEDAAIRGTQK